MITHDQIRRLRRTRIRVQAVLTRDYKPPRRLNYKLSEGTVVEIVFITIHRAGLYVSGKIVDDCFPYTAAELLE